MGQMFTYDHHQSHDNYENFEFFTLDDVDAAFNRVIQLKHNQSVALTGKGTGMVITPLPAGHMIGSTIWRIIKDDNEEFVYATDYNHKKERHLNGCILADRDCPIRQPALFITDCLNVAHQSERRSDRDAQLFGALRSTLSAGGNVLLPVDTAGRILELCQLLEQTWRSDRALQVYPVVILNVVGYSVIEYAKSLLEFMAEKLMKTFESARSNPFQFRYIQVCLSLRDLNQLPEPRVVLASQPDLESGFARELFFDFASNPLNLILFISKSLNTSLASQLLELAKEEQEGTNEKPWKIKLDRKMKVPLVDKELEEYLEKQRREEEERQKKEAEENKAKGKESGERAEGDDDEDDSDEDDEHFFVKQHEELEGEGGADGTEPASEYATTTQHASTKALNRRRSSEADGLSAGTATTGGQIVRHDLMLTRSEAGGRVKGGGFFKAAKRSYPMFPFIERKLKWDDYGELINPEDYVIFDMSRMMLAANNAHAASEAEKENTDNMYEYNPMKMGGGGNETGNAFNNLGKYGGKKGDKQPQVTPTKCITISQEIAVQCNVQFIDFEGRTDGVGMMMVLQNLKPRRLILVRGEPELRAAFREKCIATRYFDEDKVYVPEVLETVDATTERHIYKVKLTDALFSSLQFAPCRNGAELAWVDAEIELEKVTTKAEDEAGATAATVDEDGQDRMKIAHKGRQEVMPLLNALPLAKVPPHDTIFVNELRLSDFKPILMAHGIPAEFNGGVLVCCNGRVEVKRSEGGRIHIEGTVCEDYFKVRQLLYQQYAIL